MLVKSNDNYLPSFIGDFWREDLFPVFGREQSPAPAVNITEDDSEFKIEVAAPGVDKENFSVHVEKNIVGISVEKEEQKEFSEKKYLRKEFSYSNFKRTFSLPSYADAENISASHKDGVLTVAIPKKDEAKVNPKKLVAIA